MPDMQPQLKLYFFWMRNNRWRRITKFALANAPLELHVSLWGEIWLSIATGLTSHKYIALKMKHDEDKIIFKLQLLAMTRQRIYNDINGESANSAQCDNCLHHKV